ncbi:MAG: outer membrane beta-barrel protein [Chitinophagales bacterium]
MNLIKARKDFGQKGTFMSYSRKFIAMCILSLTCGSLFAQTGFDFGLKGIIQTSSLLNNTDQAAGNELNFKNNIAMGAGIAGGYSFSNHIGAELNILYSKQGQGYTGDVTQISNANSGILSNEFKNMAGSNNITFSGNYTADIALTCIKIPILFRYTGDNTKKWYFSSFIGPQIDMLSSAAMQINGQNASFAPYHVKMEDLYKKMTVDAVLGVGAACNLSDHIVLSVHFRLDYGLGDVENKSAATPTFGGFDKFYAPARTATHNATGGALISLNYKLIKKTKEADKTKAAPGKKK